MTYFTLNECVTPAAISAAKFFLQNCFKTRKVHTNINHHILDALKLFIQKRKNYSNMFFFERYEWHHLGFMKDQFEI